MQKLVSLCCLISFSICLMGVPAQANGDARNAFIGYIRTLYTARSLEELRPYLPDSVVDTWKQNSNEQDRKALKDYKATYIGNIRFLNDQVVDQDTEVLEGTGTTIWERHSVDVSWNAVMKREGGWKVKEWHWLTGPIVTH